MTPRTALLTTMFLISFALVLLELALTRVFAVVLFASFAHLALALALMGIGAGALAQHLWPHLVPEEGLTRRLGWWSMYLSASAVVAVIAAVSLPVTIQFDAPPTHFGERSSVHWDLIDPIYFPLLLPILAIPFAIGGLIFAGVFQRRKAQIGELYAADLIGGAMGAIVFVPMLYLVSGPDAVFAVALAGSAAALALFIAASERAGTAVSVGTTALLGGALFLSVVGDGLLPVRFAAGYAEENVTWTRWTPLTRLALHEDDRGVYMLLDNTSASEVIVSRPRRAARALEPNRSLVYRIHEPPARVAILAASAGPEVAVAQLLGFEEIDAIDIAPQIADTVAERFGRSPVNPFSSSRVKRVVLDGRAAILHSDTPYDIIQMVHANLHSSAGLLANAWSPALLETRQAFHTYFDHLSPNGTLSFARGPNTHQVGRAVVQALRERGVEQPERHLLMVRGAATVLLAKQRPFTRAERDRVQEALDGLRHDHRIDLDPIVPDPDRYRQVLRGAVLTDAHPYFDTPAAVWRGLKRGVTRIFQPGEDTVPAAQVLYHTLAWQLLLVAAAGLALVGIPLLQRARRPLVSGVSPVLGYVACLGYGYLAIETVLIHELVLFVGHPTYAVTVVILAMLLLSGLGSLWAQRLPEARLQPTLTGALLATLVLGALQAWVVPEVLHGTALGLPLAVRAGLTLLVLSPLGFVMGLPFPLAIRLLPDQAASIVPWAWAINGYMSVVASLTTVIVSRAFGYPTAFAVALAAYALALGLSARIRHAGA